ncbi:hypothetical protein SK571_24935 [Lentzea sp. BCCO 10_0798]|uniref:Uncharacterized protein n=1 Tax=Lentzea kristufekii TaxID=3095430 RepID=A0ABU4TWE4_9PSEU|nr:MULTISPECIES: hypothetical protein [unclassified Lentzea]MCX2950949.1 hypothetical protein [Lentzea sp. NEAU-D7]MDX8052643.1 hypothetical protein [Lentzea sp. BCCO 10_0798]
MTEHQQFTTPEGGGEPVDEEPDAVATEAGGGEFVTSPEETAMHIEETEEGGGRVDRPGDGYLDE